MIKYFKKNKTMTLLVLMTVVIFIIGLLLPSIINNNIEKEINNNLNSFIQAIKNSKLNYISLFRDMITNKLLLIVIIILLGVSVVGIPIIILLYASKVLIGGLELSFLIQNIRSYNLLFIIVYLLPKLFDLLLLGLLIYYALNFSIFMIRILFINKQINVSKITFKYITICIIITILSIFINLSEYFLYTKVLKYLI